ncbi:MAG: right-handed parallel beta-helix repeat-containing protein, partial [Candidatus Poribacteria bacterium]
MPTIANAYSIHYVDGSKNGNGSSWANANKYLQDALFNASSGDEIWVAKGTYYPDEGAGQTNDARASTFQLISGVSLYGGFFGNETSLSQRNWTNNPTILSGDLDQSGIIHSEDDDWEHYHAYYSDAYHVVTGANNAVLDGFTITRGRALNDPYSVPLTSGGGMYNNNSSPTVTNCIFLKNTATHGAGMYNDNSSSPTVTDCTFSRNGADVGGGMTNMFSSSSTVTNCIFDSNDAYSGAGGMSNWDAS